MLLLKLLPVNPMNRIVALDSENFNGFNFQKYNKNKYKVINRFFILSD